MTEDDDKWTTLPLLAGEKAAAHEWRTHAEDSETSAPAERRVQPLGHGPPAERHRRVLVGADARERAVLRFPIQEVWRRHGRGSALCRFLYFDDGCWIGVRKRAQQHRLTTLKIAVFAPMPSASVRSRQREAGFLLKDP